MVITSVTSKQTMEWHVRCPLDYETLNKSLKAESVSLVLRLTRHIKQ